jgi:lipopolysaccharide assembly protein A
MRLGVVVLILLSIVFGATFGALNSQRIDFDLYFTVLSFPKGAALLAFLLVGWILGGLLVWFVRVRHLRRELRIALRQLRALRAESAEHSGSNGSTGSA